MPPEKCYAATTENVSNNNIDSAYSNDPLNLYTKKPWEIAPTIKLPDNESYIGPASKNAIPLQYDWQYDALNIRTAPIENKLQHFADFLNDRYLKPAKLYLTSIGSIAGMGKYSELYADFTIGSIFETGFTITGSGIKSASALIKGESISKESIIAGSGAGNLTRFKNGIKNRNIICKNCEKHIFSDKHIKGGIMDLGSSKQEVMDSALDIVEEADKEKLLFDGSTQIKTSINGYDAEIRIYIDNDNELRSFDVFKGHSSTDKGNTIYYKCRDGV